MALCYVLQSVYMLYTLDRLYPHEKHTLTWYEGSVYLCIRSKCFMMVNMMLTSRRAREMGSLYPMGARLSSF